MQQRIWIVAGQTVLGVVLLAGWAFVTDLSSVARVLGDLRWEYLLPGLAFSAASTLLRSLRWRQVLQTVAKVRSFDILLIVMVSSLINFILPIRSGEIARSLFLKRRNSIALSVSLPTIASDRALDMLAVLLIGGVAVVGGQRLGSSASLALVAGVGLFVVFTGIVAIAIASRDRLLSMLDRATHGFLGEGLRSRLLAIVNGVLLGFTAIGKNPRRLAQLIVLSIGAALLDAAVIYLVFVGVGNPIPFELAATGYAIFAITFLVPGAPGYVGSFEAFGSLVFGGALGVEAAIAAGAVLIYHALNALFIGLSGGIAFWLLGLRPIQLLGSALGEYPTQRANQPE